MVLPSLSTSDILGTKGIEKGKKLILSLEAKAFVQSHSLTIGAPEI